MNWLKEGKYMLGYDENGEKMYSLTNGARLLVSFVMAAGLVALVVGVVLVVQWVAGFIWGAL